MRHILQATRSEVKPSRSRIEKTKVRMIQQGDGKSKSKGI